MYRRQPAVLIATVLLMMLLTACQPVAEPTPMPDPDVEANQSADALDGEDPQAPQADPDAESAPITELSDTAWTVVSYGAERQITPIEGSDPYVEFMISRYMGDTGCNFLLGTFTVDDDALLVRWPSMTSGGCEDEELLTQETNFLAALTAVETFAIEDDRLHLFVGDVAVMTMEPLAPLPFEGTTWRFRFSQSSSLTWVPPVTGAEITAIFDGETLTGNAGCNDYSAFYTRDGLALTISEISVTEKMCLEPEGIMEQEQQYLQNLSNAGAIIPHARSLEIRDSEGLPFMLFSAN